MNTAVSHALGSPANGSGSGTSNGSTSVGSGGGFLSGENTKFFIHVAAEAVVIAGVTYYLSGRCTTLENIVFEQSQKIKKLEETLAAHENALGQIFNALQGAHSQGNRGGEHQHSRESKKSSKKSHKKQKEVEVPTHSHHESEEDEGDIELEQTLDQELEGEV